VGYLDGPEHKSWRSLLPFAAEVTLLVGGVITISPWVVPLVLAVSLAAFDGPIWLHNRRLLPVRSGA